MTVPLTLLAMGATAGGGGGGGALHPASRLNPSSAMEIFVFMVNLLVWRVSRLGAINKLCSSHPEP
jgi:hypothetical protein